VTLPGPADSIVVVSDGPPGDAAIVDGDPALPETVVVLDDSEQSIPGPPGPGGRISSPRCSSRAET
jgi:hypothetical protein